MAATPQPLPTTGIASAPGVPVKKRRTRSPSVAKPAFIVVQVLGEDGEPIAFEKKRLKIVAVERSAEKVMEMMEDNKVENALYLRVIVPVARVGAPRTPAAA